MAYQGGLKRIFPNKELARSRVMEIAPDAWMIEGYSSTDFASKPSSSNCFVLRDENMVLLLDTGTYPFFRERILNILKKFRSNGADSLVLMNTHGHMDHVANNDVVLEAGFENVRYLLPEAEKSVLDAQSHFTHEFEELNLYYDYFREIRVLPIKIVGLISRALAQRLFLKVLDINYRGVNTLVDRARILMPDDKVQKTYGDVEFSGWEVGRFFAIHDGTHSPGHVSLYDPENKLLLTGDATLELNPTFMNSSLDQCIHMMDKFMRLAQSGHVKLATDAHRSSLWMKELGDHFHYEPLNRVQLLDLMKGQDACLEFYSFLHAYYLGIKNEVLNILRGLGEASVPRMVRHFKASDNPYARFKSNTDIIKVTSSIEVLVANVFKEAKIKSRKQGNRIVFFYGS